MLLEDSARLAGKRTTLADYFAQLTDSSAAYLQYDNGYRSWSYTYRQVGAAARAFSAKLDSQGITQGDKIIFWSENRPEWVAAFWGCVVSGVVVVPVDYRASAEFLQRVQGKVSARAILIGDEVRSPSWEKQPAVWRLSELDWVSTNVSSRTVALQPNDIAEIVFTSGIAPWKMLAALRMALARRAVAPGLVHHSDRGS